MEILLISPDSGMATRLHSLITVRLTGGRGGSSLSLSLLSVLLLVDANIVVDFLLENMLCRFNGGIES